MTADVVDTVVVNRPQDNVYNIPNFRGLGYTCKTNLATNTAFRGFGGPQGLFFAESWITDVASVCGLAQHEVREKNFYKEGDKTHFSQELDDCQVSDTPHCTTRESVHLTNLSTLCTSFKTFGPSSRSDVT